MTHNISAESSLCWAYSSASMIRRSLKDFYKKHKDADLNLTSTEKAKIEKWLDENKFHSILRSQIIMNPIPKRIKKDKSKNERAPRETHYIKEASERVSQVGVIMSHDES